MKKSFRFLTLAALALLPLMAVQAQVTYTSSAGGGITTDLSSRSAIQTFSGFSNISEVSWTVNSSTTPFAFGSFNLYYAQWNAASGVISGSLAQFGGTSQNLFLGVSSAAFDFSGSMTLDPSLTYVLVLSNTQSSTTGFSAASGLTPGAPDATFFGTGGVASVGANDTVGSLASALSSPTAIATNYAYQMSVTGIAASPSPVPEPKTAAAGIAALFVAALVGRRLWQRRKAAAEPLAA